MSSKEYNLLDEPWILATDVGGRATSVSLLDVFARAHELRSLSGELPTQDVAILRLLLAVLYAVFTRVDTNGTPLQPEYDAYALWKELWSTKQFPMDVVGQHLHDCRERFWLFHPERPFWQVTFDSVKPPINKDGVSLRPASKEASLLIGDIAESDNKPNMFCGRGDKASMSFAEAARWLVHLNAFGFSPAGNLSKNSKTIKGFSLPWPANFSIVWLSGDTLFETLLLNLVLLNNDSPWPKGKAYWESPPPCTTADDLEHTEIIRPESIVTLMSLQYRYITLKRNGSSVTGFDLWSGVWFDTKNLFIEQMTTWEVKKGAYFPRKQLPSRQMWRDFAAFLPQKASDIGPGVIKWIEALRQEDAPLKFFQLNVAGMEYKNKTAIDDVFFDNLQLNSGLLSMLDENSGNSENWTKRIVDELKVTEDVASYLGRLALEIAEASGDRSNSSKKRDAAIREAYFQLDLPFRDWLSSIDPQRHDKHASCLQWRRITTAIVLRLGEDLVSQASKQAFTGRGTTINQLATTPKAYIKFKGLVYHRTKED